MPPFDLQSGEHYCCQAQKGKTFHVRTRIVQIGIFRKIGVVREYGMGHLVEGIGIDLRSGWTLVMLPVVGIENQVVRGATESQQSPLAHPHPRYAGPVG